MTDVVDRQTRSKMMSNIRGHDTKPEMVVRRALHGRGFRYRVNQRKLPGSPDLVFRKHRAVIFVHGCFWHRHKGCPKATSPKQNAAFWRSKFQANVDRDRRNIADLHSLGWRVAVVWECSLKDAPYFVIDQLENFLMGDQSYAELP